MTVATAAVIGGAIYLVLGWIGQVPLPWRPDHDVRITWRADGSCRVVWDRRVMEGTTEALGGITCRVGPGLGEVFTLVLGPATRVISPQPRTMRRRRYRLGPSVPSDSGSAWLYSLWEVSPPFMYSSISGTAMVEVRPTGQGRRPVGTATARMRRVWGGF